VGGWDRGNHLTVGAEGSSTAFVRDGARRYQHSLQERVGVRDINTYFWGTGPEHISTHNVEMEAGDIRIRYWGGKGQGIALIMWQSVNGGYQHSQCVRMRVGDINTHFV
jgi:hypothetical protein